MIYAGIGSRETPEWVLTIFERMGSWMAKRGDILRSGGADGADSAFENGCNAVNGQKEIYLPWDNFNGKTNGNGYFSTYSVESMSKATEIAKKYHLYWDNLSRGGRALMTRNSFQALGLNLDRPADFIVCYTDGGKLKGGTAQALRIAADYQIPVFNAGNYANEQDLKIAFNRFYFGLLHKEKDEIKDDGQIPALRGELSFLSNMYLCNVTMQIDGIDYTFPSAENAYQALKNHYCGLDVVPFCKYSPAEAKKFARCTGIPESFHTDKVQIMREVLFQKFKQNPDLAEKLSHCNFEIQERNNWNDTFWGICRGTGENMLGKLLMETRNRLQQKDISEIGKTLLQYQADLAAKYRYKPLKEDMREIARSIYQDTLPFYFTDENNAGKPIHSPTGEIIATGYDRIVIGDYGAFIEIDSKDMQLDNVYIPEKQKYRVEDPEYAEHVKYLWYEPKNGYPSKLYDQKKTVTYADYKADKWYVSPFETSEGYYEISKKIELPLIPPQREYYKTEDGYVNKVTGEKKTKLNRGDVEIEMPMNIQTEMERD